MFSKCLLKSNSCSGSTWVNSVCPHSLASMCDWQLSCSTFTVASISFLLSLPSFCLEAPETCSIVHTEAWERLAIHAVSCCYTCATPSLPIWLHFALVTIRLGHGLTKYIWSRKYYANISHWKQGFLFLLFQSQLLIFLEGRGRRWEEREQPNQMPPWSCVLSALWGLASCDHL